MKKIRNTVTGEVITAFKLGKSYLLDFYNDSEEGNKPIHPRKMTWKEIEDAGLDLIKDDDDWEIIEK